MISKLRRRKFTCYGVLLLGVMAYLILQNQIETYQAKFKMLNQERRKLVHKINQIKQLKIDHAKVWRDFKQAQDSKIVMYYTQERLIQYMV